MSEQDKVAEQIDDELARCALALGSALEGFADHSDPSDPCTALQFGLRNRIREAAPVLAARLLQEDRTIAEETAVDLMHALWPNLNVTPPGGWWGTALGVAVNKATDPNALVPYSSAAAMLDLTKGRIAQLVKEGLLEPGPRRRGVTLGSVQMMITARKMAAGSSDVPKSDGGA